MIEVKNVADCMIVMVDGPESIARFKELVHRATNLWPDASPEVKEFADEVTNYELINTLALQHTGTKKHKGLQNYHTQNTSRKGATK